MFSSRSISTKFAWLALLSGAAGLSAQINPNQINFAGQTGCTTATYPYVPADSQCEAPSAYTLTGAKMATAVSGLTGCTTAGYAWVPEDSACEAVGGGGGSIPAAVVAQSAFGAQVTTSGGGVTWPGHVGAGDMIVAKFMHSGSGSFGVSDTQGDVFTEAVANEQLLSGQFDVHTWFSCNVHGGATIVQNSQIFTIVALYDISGAAAVGCLETSNSGQSNNIGSLNFVSTGSVTTVLPNDLIIVDGGVRTGGPSQTLTEANGYTNTITTGLQAGALNYVGWYGIQSGPATISDAACSL